MTTMRALLVVVFSLGLSLAGCGTITTEDAGTTGAAGSGVGGSGGKGGSGIGGTTGAGGAAGAGMDRGGSDGG